MWLGVVIVDEDVPDAGVEVIDEGRRQRLQAALETSLSTDG